MQLNQEINLGTSHPPTVQKMLERVFAADFERAAELHETLPLRWMHHVAEAFADEAL